MYKSSRISYIALYSFIDRTISSVNSIINNEKYDDISEEQVIELKRIIAEINAINTEIEVVYAGKGDNYENLSKTEKEIINDSVKDILSIISNELYDVRNSDILIDTAGIVLKSIKYIDYSINIQQDVSTQEYIVYLWQKNSDADSFEFKFKNMQELHKFFDDNDILVQWEDEVN